MRKVYLVCVVDMGGAFDDDPHILTTDQNKADEFWGKMLADSGYTGDLSDSVQVSEFVENYNENEDYSLRYYILNLES